MSRQNRKSSLMFMLSRICCGLVAFVSLLLFANVVDAESFTAPYGGNLYLQCIGGSAGATSQFGIGSSPANFVAYLNGLPSGCPDAEVLVGPVAAGQTVEFGISTLWLGQTYWAFSGNTDEASIVSFTDVCNTLGMNGKIIQQTSPTTWVMHLNDAAHYTISQCEANNILVQIRLASTPCSLQSLSGAYTYVFRGFKFGGNEHGFSAVGRLVADGNGNFTGADTVSDAGAITRDRQYTGTYTMNADCTGSARFSGLGQMDFVMTNNNQNVNFIQIDEGTDIVGTAQQQFH
jgi:hypothetical protein